MSSSDDYDNLHDLCRQRRPFYITRNPVVCDGSPALAEEMSRSTVLLNRAPRGCLKESLTAEERTSRSYCSSWISPPEVCERRQNWGVSSAWGGPKRTRPPIAEMICGGIRGMAFPAARRRVTTKSKPLDSLTELADDPLELPKPSGEEAMSVKERERKVARSIDHLLCHFPMCRACPTCRIAKGRPTLHIDSRSRRMKTTYKHQKAEAYGQNMTADHLDWGKQWVKGHRGMETALSVFDIGTGFLECIPVPSKDARSSKRAFQTCVGRQPVEYMYTDGAKSLIKACETLGYLHDTSTPGDPRNNGVIENKNKLIIEAVRCLHYHSGVPLRMWPYSSRLHGIQKSCMEIGGSSPWVRRFHEKPAFPK